MTVKTEENKIQSLNKGKRDIMLFLVFAFSIPLVCSALIVSCSLFKSGIFYLVLYGIADASPALAAILIVLIASDSTLKNFLLQKYIKNISLKYCLIGLFVPAIVITSGKLISNFVMDNNVLLVLPGLNKVIIISWALFAEELGWRGYLQEKLDSIFGTWLTPLIIGVIWALWHYHFFITGSMEVPYIAFAYGCIVESYGYYVITKLAKGNVVPASIWHFSGNLFFELCLINPNWNGGSMVPYYIVNGLYTVYIFAFIAYYKMKYIKQ